MGMQRYRADVFQQEKDGSETGWANWMGGPTLSMVKNCRVDLANVNAPMRSNVFITGEPDTWYSTPAVTSIKGCRVKGYVTTDDDGNPLFRPVYY
jgi:hypothetical protein